MIARVLKAALVAGFLAACVATSLQLVLTTPLILQAETYETGALHEAGDAARGDQEPVHRHGASHDEAAADEWKPGDGLPRAAFTFLATLVSGVGYALVLAALLLATGHDITVQRATRWAVGGFLAVNLAPAIGLPPELPGMAGGHLAARQAWWIGTALGTGAGLYLFAVVRTRGAIALGFAAIAHPHLIGAPHAAASSEIPAALAAQFAVRSLAVALVFWGVLGASLGWCWGRLEDGAGSAPPVV
jgi:cobalt transporter subunit CbtA